MNFTDAACRQTSIMFVPVDNEFDPAPARRVCHGCPISLECLEYALASKAPVGVWGGFNLGSVSERKYARRFLNDRIRMRELIGSGV